MSLSLRCIFRHLRVGLFNDLLTHNSYRNNSPVWSLLQSKKYVFFWILCDKLYKLRSEIESSSLYIKFVVLFDVFSPNLSVFMCYVIRRHRAERVMDIFLLNIWKRWLQFDGCEYFDSMNHDRCDFDRFSCFTLLGMYYGCLCILWINCYTVLYCVLVSKSLPVSS